MSLRKRISFLVALICAIAAVLIPSITTATAADNRGDYNTSSACGDQWPYWSLYKAFDHITVRVNGKTVVDKHGSGPMSTSKQRSRILDDVAGPGDTITVSFVLAAQCDNTYVASSIYYTDAAKFNPQTASQQKLAWRSGKAYKAGVEHTITTTLPSNCYYQWDFNTGWEYQPGNYELDHLGRLYFAGNGGSTQCQVTTTTKPTTTTTAPTTTTTVIIHEASAKVEQICKADGSGWKVTYTNKGNVTENLVLKSGTDTIETVSVEAGKSLTKTYLFEDYELKLGESLDLVAFLNDEEIGKLTVLNDCSQPLAEVKQACASDATGFTVTYTNEGKLDQEFELKRGSVVVDTVAIKAGEDAKVVTYKFNNPKIDLEADESTNLIVTANGEQVAITKVINNCVEVQATTTTTAPPTTTTTVRTEVLGTQIVRPQLAETGVTTNISIALGTLLLMIGFGFIALARRVRFA